MIFKEDCLNSRNFLGFMNPSKQLYRILSFVYFTIFWLSAHINYAQGLCDKNNWPTNAVEGDFKIEGDIIAGCTPMAVRLKDLSGGTDIRYDFYYDGKAANLLDKLGNKDSTNLALFSNPNSIRYYTILQYGKKNGKDMYACKTVSVRPNIQPVFSYNSCNNNTIEINIPKTNINDFDYYEINWDDGASTPEKVLSSDLPFSKTRSLVLPKTIKVEGKFVSSALNCTSPNSINIPYQIPSLFPNGYDDPNKVNIDEIQLLDPNIAQITFHGSFDANGYNLYMKEKNGTYSLKGGNYTPGVHKITLPDSNKAYCFYLDRITSCGLDPSAEICTLPMFSLTMNEKDNNLVWSDYPNNITISDNRLFGRYLDKTQKIIENKNNSDKIITIPNQITSYTVNNIDCSIKQCYRIEIETRGQLYYYKYAGVTISNEICADRKKLTPPAINDLMVSVNSNNFAETSFIDDSNWLLTKDTYYLHKITNLGSEIVDSSNYIKPLIDSNSKPSEQSECYFLKYKDECGSSSLPSTQICSINLFSKDLINLEWTSLKPFSQGQISDYEVISSDEVTKMDSLINNTKNNTYLANLDKFTIEAKFRIRGKSDRGQISYSNFLTIPIEPQFYLPNIFTPNNDNINETFEIKGSLARIKEFQIKIYDRWGNNLLELKDKNQNWDGNINLKPLNSGLYTYQLKIELNNGENIFKNGKFEVLK